MVRASAHAASSPCARRKRAPICGRHELTARHDAGARAIAHLAHQRHAGGDLAQLREVALDLLPERHAELGGECAVALLDGAQLLLLRIADGGIEQSLEPVGDAGDGGVHDEHARAARRALGATCAMLRQLASVETLVPPNFRTIQGEGVRVTTESSRRAAANAGGAQIA